MKDIVDDTWYQRPEGFAERESAGGVVVRIDRGNLVVALVREKDHHGYVIPKGGLDGQEIDAAALREIHEEAGLTEVEKVSDLMVLERQDADRKYWSINHYAVYLTEQIEGEIIDKEHHWDLTWFPLENLPDMHWPDERWMLGKFRTRIYDWVIAHKNPKKRKSMFM